MWVIFPFRAQHGKDRLGQMEKVWERIKTRFPAARRVIVRQVDGMKFNRGLLLNVGFQCCCDMNSWVVFHDVDLYPDDCLLEHYKEQETDAILHLARSFQRYADSPTYFGGINAMKASTFSRINGFPNCFWGWGGEDDELYRRSIRNGIGISCPDGTVEDLESLPLYDKLGELREMDLKCPNKKELLREYAKGMDDGISKMWDQNISLSIQKISPRTMEIVVQTHGNSGCRRFY